jgi:hypothetical protein
MEMRATVQLSRSIHSRWMRFGSVLAQPTVLNSLQVKEFELDFILRKEHSP